MLKYEITQHRYNGYAGFFSSFFLIKWNSLSFVFWFVFKCAKVEKKENRRIQREKCHSWMSTMAFHVTLTIVTFPYLTYFFFFFFLFINNCWVRWNFVDFQMIIINVESFLHMDMDNVYQMFSGILRTWVLHNHNGRNEPRVRERERNSLTDNHSNHLNTLHL